MNELTQFLKHYNLSQYYAAIKSEGADNLDDLRDLNENEVTEVANSAKLKTIHKKKFIKAVVALKNGKYSPLNSSQKKITRRQKAKPMGTKQYISHQQGSISMYNAEKRYGFISMHGDQNDVFFHRSAIKSRIKSLQQGHQVEFDIVRQQKDGRTKAINIKIIGGHLNDKPVNFKRCSIDEIKNWLQTNTNNQKTLQTLYFSLESNTTIIKTILSRNYVILEKCAEEIYGFVGQNALLNPSPLYQNMFKDKIDKFYIEIHNELCQLFRKKTYFSSNEQHQMIILNILIKLFTLIPHQMTLMINWSLIIKHIQRKYVDNEKIASALNKLNGLLTNSETEIETVNDVDNESVDTNEEEKEIENINDFLHINVLPSTFTEFIEEPKKLPIISKEKGYLSSKHLLRTHTFLMKEDLMFALRNGVIDEIANIKLKLKHKNLSIRKYNHVSIDYFHENENSELVYGISFKHRPIKWQYSKKLLYGSLVLLLNKHQLENIDNNNNGDDTINIDMIWCTVAEREVKYLEAKRPSISVQLIKGDILGQHINGKPEFIMFESSDAYFVPYQHVLDGLRKMGNAMSIIQQNNILPFENILVSVENDMKPPSYLRDDTVWNFKCILNEPFTKIERDEYFDIEFESKSYSFNVVKEWPKNLKTSLDESQLVALRHILTNQVAVIQGPPGTGKTYLALKALNILLSNLGTEKKIIVAALTNHALDQILCGILQFDDNIIRIGTRSQCEQLKDKSIRNKKRNYLWGKGVRTDYVKYRFHELRKEREMISKVLQELYGELNEGFNETLLSKYEIVPYHEYYLMAQRFKQWRTETHQIDEELQSLSRLQNTLNRFDNQYDIDMLCAIYTALNDNYYKDGHKKVTELIAICICQFVCYDNDDAVQQNSQYDNKYKNQSKWQVVGSRKKHQKAEKINEMFHNYDVQNLYELYVNEPYFMERIAMKRNNIQNEIQKKRLHSLAPNVDTLALNVKGINKNKMKSTATFVTLQHIPINQNDVEEIKEEEKKQEEIKEDDEIELINEDRKYLDNILNDIDDNKNKTSTNARLNNKMVKRDWNYFKIKNKQQKNRIDEMKKYENRLEIVIKQRINEQLIKLREINTRMKDMNKLIETNLIQQSKVIGITTTAAARLMDVINEIKPSILIFEEAAEILESHVITSLNPDLEHLILIGDHQQLRPTAATYKLITENNLEISLFERLILSGIDHKVLNVQRRMIPQICELSSFHYNDEQFNIENHETTLNRADIEGISKNVIFFNHTHYEEEDENIQSKYNVFEAKMIIELTIYLLKQEAYKPSNITILTLYRGQQLKIKSLVSKNKILQRLLKQNDVENGKNSLNIKCVDKYQGEENDIILLSLVRSNRNNKIGFLSIDNRVCVALSRAKNGLYVFGNFNSYSIASETWKKITNIAVKNDYLQNKIELKCKRHQDIIEIKQPKDFHNSPEGGCSKKCQQRMDCGHVCPRLCHSYDHKYIKCLKPCTKFHEICKHKCPRKCGDDCGECKVIVTKTVPDCSHIIHVECRLDIHLVKCPKLVNQSFAKCEHIKQIQCYQRHELVECMEIIDITFTNCKHEIKNIKCKDKLNEKYAKCQSECGQILKCGHKCNQLCYKCFENENKHQCGFKCNRIMVCGHQCDRFHDCKLQCPPCDKKCENECPHSKCNKKCGEICVVCKEQCTRLCIHHQCTAMCSEKCNFVRCNQPCVEKLECGHQCPGVCGEECLSICKEEKCGQNGLKETKDIIVFDEDFIPKKIYECKQESMFVILTDCGHIIERTAIDQYVSEYRKNNSTKIKLIPCPLCQIAIRKCRRFINIINDILEDIEYVKKQIINNQFENAKRNVVAAMSAELRGGKGHYFKCANGHYYIVGECGGAMERTKCPECDEIIGGENHKIAQGSQLATEMDGASEPKWPTVLQ